MKTLFLKENENLENLLKENNISEYEILDLSGNKTILNKIGYYEIKTKNENFKLVYYPHQCYFNENKSFGFHIQLFSLKSDDGFGIGDFNSLRTLIEYTKKIGGKFIQLNPLFPIDHSWFHSPYEPITRFAIDPIYIDIPLLMTKYNCTVEELGFENERIIVNNNKIINYEECLKLKHNICFKIFQKTNHSSNKFQKLSEKMSDLHSEYLEDINNPIDFLNWLHLEVELQFEELKLFAKKELGLGLFSDLPMGMSTEFIDNTKSINKNAFPTIEETEQKWNIASFDYNVFEKEGYDYFINSLRYSMYNFGGIRIDNDSSLFGLCFQDKKTKTDNELEFDNSDKLLAILCLESALNECQVIFECHFNYSNEELEALNNKNICFQNIYLNTTNENNDICQPDEFKSNSFLLFSTHDLYPLKQHLMSIKSNMDISNQEDENWKDFINLQNCYIKEQLEKQFNLIDVNLDKSVLFCNYLGAISSANMFSIQLNDLLLMTESVNVPNTSFGFKNWRLKLTKNIIDIFNNPDIIILLNDVKKLRKRN